MFWIIVWVFCGCSVPWFECFSVPVVAFVNYFSVLKIYVVVICPCMISNVWANFVMFYISLVFLSPSVECSASFANVAPWAICIVHVWYTLVRRHLWPYYSCYVWSWYKSQGVVQYRELELGHIPLFSCKLFQSAVDLECYVWPQQKPIFFVVGLGPGDESAVREIFNSHRPFSKILTLSDDISRRLQPEN